MDHTALPIIPGGRYRVERAVGAGGMATVYLAQDEQHDRRVAIKVLRPELAAAMGAERFLREIKLTASLQHPHILPLFDSGRIAESGLVYYVMPFVDGESLRERLQRETRLPLADALPIIREVGGALSYAHDQGLIHRDIKPDNIMLSRGHALLADFGIARAVTAATERITGTGMAVGTVDYMSPEQATGDDVDARSDQYSLACVLYEMLAGTPPFSAPTYQAALTRQLIEPVPPLRDLVEAVPAPVEAAIVAALEKEKEDRFPSVSAFVEALERQRPSPAQRQVAKVAPTRRSRRLAIASLVALVALGAATWFALRPPPINERRVLVGVFEDRTGDPALAGLAEQAVLEVTSGLARTGLVEVVDVRSSSTDASSTSELSSLQRIARSRGAASIVWGSYAKAGDSVVLHAQLTNTLTGTVWRPLRPASGPVGKPSAVASLATERVMAGYAAHFDERLHHYTAVSQPGTYSAWKEFDAGWVALRGIWSDSSVLASQEHMDRATRLDPEFVMPQAINVQTIGWAGDCRRADSLANALRLPPRQLADVDDALVKLGSVQCHPDPQAAYDATKVLLRVAPGVPKWVDAHVASLLALNRPREALAVLESSDELRQALPFEWNNRRMLLLHMLGRYEDALRAVAALRRADPDDRFVDRYEMRQLAALGRIDSVDKLLEARLSKTNRLADAGADLFYVGLELKAHGFLDAGRRTCDRAVNWYAGRPGGVSDRAREDVTLSLVCAERWSEARQAYEDLLILHPDNQMFRSSAAIAAFHAGDRAAADSMDRILARFDQDPDVVFNRAILATLRGEREVAIRQLQWAFDHGISWARLHTFGAEFAPLVDDPRVKALLHPDR